MYAISFDKSNEVVRLKLVGLWTTDVMCRFREELLRTLSHLAPIHARIAVLSSCTTYPVQPADVMEGWTSLLGKEAGVITQPYAIVVGSMLNKLQVQRGLDGPNVKAFSDMAAAEEWLANHPLR